MHAAQTKLLCTVLYDRKLLLRLTNVAVCMLHFLERFRVLITIFNVFSLGL